MDKYREEYYNYLYPRSKKIKEKIKKEGKITFARYMELVLYDKKLGYYSNENPYNDYLTSPKIHPVFGILTGKRISELWKKSGCPSSFYIIEMGGGDGTLCRQILDFAEKKEPEFYRTIKYIILVINEKEGKTLKEISPLVQPIIYGDLKIPLKNIEGCFLSNELPDAFPVHLVTRKNGELKEIFVMIEDGEIVETEDEPSTGELKNYFKKMGRKISEGNRVEVNMRMVEWIKEVSKTLKKGYVFTIDYGYMAEELFSPERKEGTLLCYYKHSLNRNPCKRAGYQDITTHVDFTTLVKEGQEYGLKAEEYKTQKDFLEALGIKDEINRLDRNQMNLIDYNKNLKAMERLIDSRGLGRIKILIQNKERD